MQDKFEMVNSINDTFSHLIHFSKRLQYFNWLQTGIYIELEIIYLSLTIYH